MRELIMQDFKTGSDHPELFMYDEKEYMYEEKLNRSTIQIETDYGQQHNLMTFHGVPCLPRQDLVAMTGRAKSGKSMATKIITAATLWGGEYMGWEATEGLLKVLYIDTEQAQHASQRTLQQIVQMSTLPYNEERLWMLNLRKESPAERLQMTIAAISRMHPDLVIIDGIRDMLTDFNSIDQSAELVGQMMTLASDFNCCILCLLHKNKAKEDDNMRGHLGTELENKCAEVYELRREENLFRLHQRLSRYEPMHHDMRFLIKKDQEGDLPLPLLYQDNEPLSASAKACAKALSDEEILTQAFGRDTLLSYQQIIKRLWPICKQSGRDATALWKEARDTGRIAKIGKDQWYIVTSTQITPYPLS